MEFSQALGFFGCPNEELLPPENLEELWQELLEAHSTFNGY